MRKAVRQATTIEKVPYKRPRPLSAAARSQRDRRTLRRVKRSGMWQTEDVMCSQDIEATIDLEDF